MRTETKQESIQTTEERTGRILTTAVFCFYAIMMFYLLFAVCFLSSRAYPTQRNWLPNIIQICGAVPVLFFMGRASIRYPRRLRGKWWKILLVIILFVFQVQAVYCYFFYSGWDVTNVVPASVLLAHGEEVSEGLVYYFSCYPNNLFLTSVFASAIRLLNALAPQTKGTEAEYVLLLVIQCALNQTTGVLVYCTAKRLTQKERFAWIAYGIYALLIGISPWVSIPYSDSMGLVFPITVLALYLKPAEGRKIIVKWLAIAGLSYLGYQIKPQTAMIPIAIAIMELFSLRQSIRIYKKEILKALAGICLGFICMFGIVEGNLRLSGQIQIDSEKRLGVAHSLMMGMNPENGLWSLEDVNFSKGIGTNRERDAADLQRAGDRIREMGIGGMMNQFTKKALVNFNDGTFAWENEGGFYATVREEPRNAFSEFLRNLYYHDGKYQNYWMYLSQFVWVSVLCLAAFTVFSQKNKTNSVMMLSVVGLILFLFLFEARARYVFTNAPIFVLLAVQGLSNLCGYYERKTGERVDVSFQREQQRAR